MLLGSAFLTSCSTSKSKSNLPNIGPLQAADANGCRLPEGFSSRIVARSGQPVSTNSDFVWHAAPDGGACYPTADGWIYVSNAELSDGKGGASALRFDQKGNVMSGYPILEGSTRNCAGGTTPYGTWLSCEESGDGGRVFECDPTGVNPAVERPLLGYFNHEAVAYDIENHVLYLTEDNYAGRFYRYVPNRLNNIGFADLGDGRLEVAQVAGKKVVWHHIEDPLGKRAPTRTQVEESTVFLRGEGICYHDGEIFFTTTADNTVWQYNTKGQTISKLYSAAPDAKELREVDNITASAAGDILVAEDSGELRVVYVAPDGTPKTLVQMEGHDDSEVTGPAFSPDQSRLYFSSQRGTTGKSVDGITFEITGPFTIS